MSSQTHKRPDPVRPMHRPSHQVFSGLTWVSKANAWCRFVCYHTPGKSDKLEWITDEALKQETLPT